MLNAPIVKSLQELLDQSAASPDFKAAALVLERGGIQDRIVFNAGSPPVKVLRVIMKLLEVLPEEAIDRVEIRANSGCSNFTGLARILPGEVMVDFDWDCRWRAEERDWKDAFGDPDQIRAAREFGYQCFAEFRVSRQSTAEFAPGG